MKFKLNVLAAVSITGLIIAGVDAPTLLSQITISSIGVAMFAGGMFTAVNVVRKNGGSL